MKKTIFIACALAAMSPTLSAMAADAAVAASVVKTISNSPDTTNVGPYAVASAEYRFAATTDKDVLSDRMTEVWAEIFYPKNIATQSGKAPLIVMLHGNHATCGSGSNPRSDTSCEYTYSGSCPTGFVPVPNHKGYDYIAENLSSLGFIVVSINANRGITCGGGVSGDGGLNLARGKLVLRHLSLLHTWATAGGAPSSIGLGADGLLDKIDFSSVGLFGHSRGGEGVRAAYNLYSDAGSIWPTKIPGLSIKAIYEVGAVDGQTSRTLNANGIVWNQLLPMCDGDVSDLQGRYPFERMLMTPTEPTHAQKSLYEVWGANHNFFNTEWQGSDSYSCSYGTPIFDKYGSGSEKQKKIALASVTSFFRSRLGTDANATFNRHFNPLDSLPTTVTDLTQIDRDFTPSPAASEFMLMDDFDKETGTSSSGHKNLASQITIKHEALNRYVRTAAISWSASGKGTFFETVWAEPGKGKDIHDLATLDFRIARKQDSLNSTPTTDFSIQLEEANGKFSNEIPVSKYAVINGPGTSNSVLKTVRIPLSAFNGVDLTKIHGVRFVFNQTTTGYIYLSNVRLHRNKGLGAEDNSELRLAQSMARTQAMENAKPVPVEIIPANKNSLRVVHSRTRSGEATVEVLVASTVPFPAMNSLPVLKVGDKEFNLSRYTDLSNLKEMAFTLTPDQYNSLSKSSEVTVTDGKIWKFGTITKNARN